MDSTLSVVFGTDGKITGSGGVNIFNGTFESGATSVKIGPLATTMMTGSPELMAQETVHLTALQNSTVGEIQSGTLTMRDASGATQIIGVKP